MSWLGHNCCYCGKPDTDEDDEEFCPLSGDDWACPKCMESEVIPMLKKMAGEE